MSIGSDDIIVYLLLLGLLAFVSLIISGLIFITEPLFQNNDITLTDPNLGIAKMAIVIGWISLPITFFTIAKLLTKILESNIGIIIILLGLLLLLAFILYGLSILTMGLFNQDGVYINTLTYLIQPSTTPPTSTPTSIIPPTPSSTSIIPPTPTLLLQSSPTVYSDTFTINCLKIAIIFAWLSISWNITFFVKETSDF